MRADQQAQVLTATTVAKTPAPRRRSGFTIIELLVCLGVVAVLCAILLPALRATRESSLRVRCQANLHSIGVAIAAYANIHDERIPSSRFAEPEQRQPQELMTMLVAAQPGLMPSARWDGLGWLVHGNFLHDGCQCLYCPSHHGEHSFEEESDELADPGPQAVFTNYHYVGHMDARGRRISLLSGSETMLATDGLRTREDFNHKVGANRLFADLHVDWWYDSGNELFRALPEHTLTSTEARTLYDGLWGIISQTRNE